MRRMKRFILFNPTKTTYMMKRVLLLLLSVCIFGACHKKEYPVFNYPQAESYGQSKPATASELSSPTTQPAATVLDEAPLLATTHGGLATVIAAPAALPAEAVSASLPQAIRKAPGKLSLSEKIVARKVQKKIEKAQSPRKAAKAKAQIDTVSLLSLIAGGGGLILLLLGVGAGILFGLVGLILGIVGLSRIRRGSAPSSSRAMAILGIVFGGLVTLLGIIVIAAVASYGFI
jgi:hypothetical protein